MPHKVLLPVAVAAAFLAAATINPPPVTRATTAQRSAPRNPPAAVLRELDSLLDSHRFDEAHQRMEQLLKKHSSSPELHYTSIKALTLEVKWATTLGGDQRVEVMKDLMFYQDYLGLICGLTLSYKNRFGPSDKHHDTVKKLHELADASLRGAPCRHRPLRQFDVDQFVARLVPFADFVKGLEKFTIE